MRNHQQEIIVPRSSVRLFLFSILSINIAAVTASANSATISADRSRIAPFVLDNTPPQQFKTLRKNIQWPSSPPPHSPAPQPSPSAHSVPTGSRNASLTHRNSPTGTPLLITKSAKPHLRLLVAHRANAYHQLIHSVALLGGEQAAPKNIYAKSLFTAGMAMFSGSIYLLVLDPQRFKFMGPVTPLGGLCLIGGWVALAVGSRGRSLVR